MPRVKSIIKEMRAADRAALAQMRGRTGFSKTEGCLFSQALAAGPLKIAYPLFPGDAALRNGRSDSSLTSCLLPIISQF
jgi:hypothetical protein